MKTKKTSIYLADISRKKLSNRMGWIDMNKEGEIEKYIREELKLFPEAVWIKIHGFDFSPISSFLKKEI